MSRIVVIALLAIAVVVGVVLLGRGYFTRTHSLEVYLKEYGNVTDRERIKAVEDQRLSGDRALRSGQYIEAEREYLSALKDAEQFGVENMLMAFCYHDLAGLYSTQARYDEAEPLFRKAAQIWATTRGPNDPYVATALNNLAELLRMTGRANEAAPLEARIAAIRRASTSPATQR